MLEVYICNIDVFMFVMCVKRFVGMCCLCVWYCCLWLFCVFGDCIFEVGGVGILRLGNENFGLLVSCGWCLVGDIYVRYIFENFWKFEAVLDNCVRDCEMYVFEVCMRFGVNLVFLIYLCEFCVCSRALRGVLCNFDLGV